MGQRPSGTITFLFTDIEGSTRLLQQLRDRYGEVLADHRRLLRAAFEARGGREIDTQGDAFFVAFARARDAVAAAVEGQRALAAHSWPDGIGVRVRMGLHTGEPALGDAGYHGLAVHRGARICAAGHGGQVLVSSSTRELVTDELPPDVALRDLGEHRLKDLDRPEHLSELVIGDLSGDFPPLRSLSPGAGRATGLPPSPNRTIGRADDVAAIAERLGDGDVRLLTLTGPGGVGKTRLGLEAARAAEGDFADGARFVPLAALPSARDVPAAIVKALASVVLRGESAEDAAERFLAVKHLLLVIDNVEHVLAAAPFIGRLLQTCPALTVLATSREPLGLQGEARYAVSPLVEGDAVALFRARARAHDPGFDLDEAGGRAVAEICRRLDGLPLAIELAAARCVLLSPDEIAERLQDALAVLGTAARDAPARQATLRATIDWSHELLTSAEQQCFARLAVFAGGATVQAAETITHARLDTIEGLATKSLLVRTGRARTPTRVWMLSTIRAYAGERLAASPDAQAVSERHHRYYLSLAQRHGAERVLWSAGGGEHLDVLDADADNLRAALGWAISQADAEHALALAAALGCYWRLRNRYAEALEWVDHALSRPGADAHPALRVCVLETKARCVWQLGRGAEQAAVVAEAEALARRLGDAAILSRALQLRVDHEMDMERVDVADVIADEALHWAEQAGDPWVVAEASDRKAIAASSIADLRDRVETSARLLTDVGNVHRLANLLTGAAYVALCLGCERDAAAFAARATPLVQALDSRFLQMINSGNRGLAALLTGDADAASEAFREQLRLCRTMVVRPAVFEGLRGLAAVAVVHGDDLRAATLLGAADTHRYDMPGDPVEARLDAAFFEPARERRRSGGWEVARRDGQALGFEDAIAYALRERPGVPTRSPGP